MNLFVQEHKLSEVGALLTGHVQGAACTANKWEAQWEERKIKIQPFLDCEIDSFSTPSA